MSVSVSSDAGKKQFSDLMKHVGFVELTDVLLASLFTVSAVERTSSSSILSKVGFLQC